MRELENSTRSGRPTPVMIVVLILAVIGLVSILGWLLSAVMFFVKLAVLGAVVLAILYVAKLIFIGRD